LPAAEAVVLWSLLPSVAAADADVAGEPSSAFPGCAEVAAVAGLARPLVPSPIAEVAVAAVVADGGVLTGAATAIATATGCAALAVALTAAAALLAASVVAVVLLLSSPLPLVAAAFGGVVGAVSLGSTAGGGALGPAGFACKSELFGLLAALGFVPPLLAGCGVVPPAAEGFEDGFPPFPGGGFFPLLCVADVAPLLGVALAVELPLPVAG
jgi:hypothetical protein